MGLSSIAQFNGTVQLMCMGDSNTAGTDGTYSGMLGGWQQPMVQYLRTLRSDFDVVGSLATNFPENNPGSSLWFNEGHPGYTIAQLAAAYAGYVATSGVGPPDILVGDMAGTNDISTGRTLAQMQADTLTLYQTVMSKNPNTVILLMAPPPFVAGTTTGANLAAWNTQQQQFLAWLTSTFVPARSGNVVYCGASQLVGAGDFISDGVHFNQHGGATVGVAVAQQLHQIMGTPRYDASPRVFSYRQPWQTAKLTVTATDGVQWTSHTGFNPGSGSYTFAFDFCPTTVDNNGGNQAIAQYGTFGTNNFWALVRQGSALYLYWNSNAAFLISSVQYASTSPGLQVNQWHRIVVVADASTSTVGLYVNGVLWGLATAVPGWSYTLQNMWLGGGGGTWVGSLGYYGRVQAYNAVPGRPGRMQALLAVERDYWLGTSIVPGSGTASFSCDGVSSDDQYAPGAPNPSFSFSGSAAFAGAFPLGTPARPWEIATPTVPPTQMPGITPANATVALTPTQLANQEIESSGNSSGTVTITASVSIPGWWWICRNNNTSTSTTTFFGVTVAIGKTAMIRINSAGIGERVTADT